LVKNCKENLIFIALLMNSDFLVYIRGLLYSIDLTEYLRRIRTFAYSLAYLFCFSVMLVFCLKIYGNPESLGFFLPIVLKFLFLWKI